MINLSSISKTRCGLDVVSVAYYPDNKEQFALRADIVNPETGETESDWFYADGTYNKYKETDYDLVEEPLRELYSKGIPTPTFEPKEPVRGTGGAYTATIEKISRDIYVARGILDEMQDDMDSLTRGES